MTFIIRLLSLCLMVGSALAQSSLQPCKGNQSNWTNCFGSFIDVNGNGYDGQFKDGKMHGQGESSLASGNKYVGEYKHGLFSGQGIYTTANGGKYVGEFKENKPNGQGTLTYANGDEHVGEFQDGIRHGLGIELSRSGTVRQSGNWIFGRQAASFPVDKNRFTSSSINQTSITNFQSVSERERLTAEIEFERRKRQELQAELDRAKEIADSRDADRPRLQTLQRSERRVALVIGNAQYKSSPLENSVNDATDIDQALKRFGFQTTFLRNASLSQIREATRRFADQLTSADVALIYFAGHGIESKNKNYMIPVNADLKFEYELADQAYDAGAWLEMLEMIKSNNAERVNIVILDACRNNNLIGSRSLNRGLGRMDAPTGTFLSYSTAPGKVAADGGKGERNSPFTKNLLKAIQQPGQPIEEVFKEVRRNVTRETNGAQVPWESTSLTGFFSFRQTR
jgi:hypothetical protein